MKKVYLTIDDSPSTKMEEKVDFLSQHKIPAIFFCIGENMERYPEKVIYAIQKGFAIGNHSYSHPHFSKQSLDEIKTEILKTEQILDHLFAQAGQARRKYFRFPYGDKGDGLKGQLPSFWRRSNSSRKADIQDFLRKQGFVAPPSLEENYLFYEKANFHQDVDWHWTFDTIDYSDTLTQKVILQRLTQSNPKNPLVRRLKENYWLSANKKSEIILIHDYEHKHQLFFKIINELQQLPLKFQKMS